MIQRIQTVFLFVAAIFCAAFLFVPSWSVLNPNMEDGGSINIDASAMNVKVNTSTMSIDNPFTETVYGLGDNTFMLLQTIGCGLAALILLASIFMYNNRPLQIKLSYAGIFVLMLQFLMLIPLRNWLQELGGTPGTDYQSMPQWGLAFPLIALLLTWLAIKRIQKDEKLVKGMDRLR